MSKQAFDITVVLVTDDDKPLPVLSDLMNGLMLNSLIYYGENTPSDNGRPIIYLTENE